MATDCNPSLWTATAALPRFEPLRGDVRTDVLVIGGGIADCSLRAPAHGRGCRHAARRSGQDRLRRHRPHDGQNHRAARAAVR